MFTSMPVKSAISPHLWQSSLMSGEKVTERESLDAGSSSYLTSLPHAERSMPFKPSSAAAAQTVPAQTGPPTDLGKVCEHTRRQGEEHTL